MREIVTVQVGNYANFIGSHFWNFQDELLGLADNPESDEVFRNHNLDMDVLYRSGETHQGIHTYTPRLVSLDLQGSLGSVSSRGTLYNEASVPPQDISTWSGGVITQASEPLKKNLFLERLYLEDDDTNNAGFDNEKNSRSEIQDKDIVESLESGVQYWTDFSKVHYHPQSLYELSGLWMDIEHFNNYGTGRDAFSEGLRGEEINERLRFFMEECDHIQGIQFLVDNGGGFSGVAGEFLENIADEYTNIPVLLYSVQSPDISTDPKTRKRKISHDLHDAVSFSRLSGFCKLVVPVGLPSPSTSRGSLFLSIKDEKPYHTSAIYASTIHSISLPFRMEQVGPSAQSSYTCGSMAVNDLVQMLAGQARQNMVSILDVSMPAPSFTGQQNLLENLRPLTPEVAEDVEDFQAVESMTIHGAYRAGRKRASISEVKDAVQSAYENAITRPKFSHLSVSCCPLPIPLPFPSIFGNLVGQHGELLEMPVSGSSSRGSLEVHSIPMAARLRSSTAVLPFLENRMGNLRKFGIARGALGAELLRSWGFGKEEVEEIGENLSTMVGNLNPYSEESSDSD